MKIIPKRKTNSKMKTITTMMRTSKENITWILFWWLLTLTAIPQMILNDQAYNCLNSLLQEWFSDLFRVSQTLDHTRPETIICIESFAVAKQQWIVNIEVFASRLLISSCPTASCTSSPQRPSSLLSSCPTASCTSLPQRPSSLLSSSPILTRPTY